MSTLALPVSRCWDGEPCELRADADWGTPGRVLSGRFAVWNEWTEIRSHYEGHFLERVAPGAFDRSLVENADRIKILYDHGQDPQLGNKPLGPWRSWRDAVGQRYEVDLIRADYNDGFIIPAADARQLGASFRFSVPSDDAEAWETPARATKWNPDRLRERTLLDLDIFEMGPVTFGAYRQAGQGLRSATDDFYDRFLSDPLFVARFTERVGLRVVEQILTTVAAPTAPIEVEDTDARADGQTTDHTSQIREVLREAGLSHLLREAS